MKDAVNPSKTALGGLKNYIGEEFLALIQSSYTYLSKTCATIYDVDDNLVSELISSPYCSLLRLASERKELCKAYTLEVARETINRKAAYEAECPGGLTIFSCPIFYGDSIIGVSCAAVSNPPRSRFKIYDIASNFEVDPAILLNISKKSSTNHKYVLEKIREQLVMSTVIISNFFKYVHQHRQHEEELIAKNKVLEKKIQTLRQKLKQP